MQAMLANHMKVLWYNWIIICVFTLSYTISAIAAAANALSSAYKFVVIWNMLLLIAYAVAGTLILRKPQYRSALSVGALIGSSFMFIMMLLETGVLSGDNVASFGVGSAHSSTKAVTAFASLLFIFVLTFTVFLIKFRDTVLPDSSVPAAPASMPAPAFSNYGYEGGVEPSAVTMTTGPGPQVL